MNRWPPLALVHHARIQDTVLLVRSDSTQRLEVLGVHHPGPLDTPEEECRLLNQALGGEGSPAPDIISGIRTSCSTANPELVAIFLPSGAVRITANGELRRTTGAWARLDLTEVDKRCALFFTVPDATTTPDLNSGKGADWNMDDRDRWLHWLGIQPSW
ncbi:hypothetical protein LG293_17895 (plasmid) [Citricoccus nitrophenolicus]